MTLCDIFVKPRSGEERKNPGIGWLQGEQKERCEKVLNPLWDTREKLWGGRQYICTTPSCDPSYEQVLIDQTSMLSQSTRNTRDAARAQLS
jgi:hypothetical protein